MAAPTYLLVVRAPNGDVREVELLGVVVLGRDESADIRVEDKKVSRRHAAFRLEDGKVFVEDLGSANGVRVDGARIDRRVAIDRRSEVRVGGYLVTVRDKSGDADPTSWLALEDLPGAATTGPMVRAVPRGLSEAEPLAVEMVGIDPPVDGRRFRLRPGENVIGRLEECDVSILHPSVSRQHARLLVRGERVEVHDLNSANGVWVKGRRVQSSRLRHGDPLRAGDIHLRLEWPGRPVPSLPRVPAVRTGPGPRRLVPLIALLSLASVVLALGALGPGRKLSLWAGLGTATATVALDRSASSPRSAVPGPSPRSAVPGPSPGAAPVPDHLPFASARTATAPWTPRGPDGLPRSLPRVNLDFDHDGAVAAALADAESAQEAARLDDAEAALERLLFLDPIHPVGRQLSIRLDEEKATVAALARADALVAAGELAEAYRVLSAVAKSSPSAAEAKSRAETLRTSAITDALARGASDARRRSRWRRAHEQYKLALSLSPDHQEALDGLRALERKMRKAKLAFAAWSSPGTEPPKTEADRSRPPWIERYLRGDVDGAVALAKRQQRTAGAELPKQMEEAKRRFQRAKKEVSNDPSQAWALLLDLESHEQGFLPPGERSYLVVELAADLSDAFAKQGEQMFETERYREAFQRWQSGLKLDATNRRVLTGLERLERVAEQRVETSRVAARRGADAEACEGFREATLITRASSEVHRDARKLAFKVCP